MSAGAARTDELPRMPVRFDEVLGHEKAIAWLRGALASGRLPHALVFLGPDRVGKRTVARLVAAALLCDDPADRPCGRCTGCLRLAHDSHPDLFVVGREPRKGAAAGRSGSSEDGGADEEAEASKVITIDQIRDVCAHAAYAPREGRARVFIIDPAERMNHNAQNALLKTLEEPPGRAVLILVTARAHLLLPTVRSRCLSVRFAAMHAADLARKLTARGIPADDATERAALAGGRAGRAIELDLEHARQRREAVLATLEAVARGPRSLANLPSMAATISGESGEEDLLEGLELVEALLRDAALLGCGGSAEALVHPDLAPRIQKLGGSFQPARAAELIRGVERLRNRLRFHPNEKVFADCLLAALAGGPIP